MKTNQNFTATELVPAVKVGYEAGTQTPNLAWNQLPQAKVSELIESARHSIQVGTTGDTGFTDSNISAR